MKQPSYHRFYNDGQQVNTLMTFTLPEMTCRRLLGLVIWFVNKKEVNNSHVFDIKFLIYYASHLNS